MTLQVLCGSGHVNSYNLITEPQHRVSVDGDGVPHCEPWDWDFWRCKEHDCKHREYVSHTIDNKWYEAHGEESPENKTLLAALMILSTLLTIKTRMGL